MPMERITWPSAPISSLESGGVNGLCSCRLKSALIIDMAAPVSIRANILVPSIVMGN